MVVAVLPSRCILTHSHTQTHVISSIHTCTVTQWDITSSSTTTLGHHTGAGTTVGEGPNNDTDNAQSTGPPKVGCSCVSFIDERTVVSAGWDKTLHIWDCRTAEKPQVTIALPGKAFGMDVRDHLAVVATFGRRNCVIDLTQGKLLLDRESSLKYQSRCVAVSPRDGFIALGSIEGRVAVESVDGLTTPSSKKKYAFKCHRMNDTVYPVNAIEFHPRFGTFCTGGCDGTVVVWDGNNKKKLTTLPRFETSVAALAFNHDGSELAVAASYTFEEGDQPHPKDEIYIRPMLDSECQPKGKQ